MINYPILTDRHPTSHHPENKDEKEFSATLSNLNPKSLCRKGVSLQHAKGKRCAVKEYFTSIASCLD